ncbi:MAG: hypothetical protein ACSHXB_16050 [Sulfitobacter sp.]
MSFFTRFLALAMMFLVFAGAGHRADAQGAAPDLSYQFNPSSFEIGGSGAIVYTIDGTASDATSGLGFTHTLPTTPGLMTISGASASHNCASGALSANDGAGTVTFTGGSLGRGDVCTVTVPVTANAVGTYAGGVITLNSSAGSSSATSVNLTVSAASTLLNTGKTISFNTIDIGEIARVSYSFENVQSTGGTNVTSLSFSETLPAGVKVAANPNLAETCEGPSGETLNVPANGTAVSFFFNGFNFSGFEVLAPGESCAIAFDVVGISAGNYTLTSSNINNSGPSLPPLSVNLTVDAPSSSEPQISKSFATALSGPGEIVDLTFNIFNPNRSDSMTALSFTDDLDAMLAGTVMTGGPLADPCGAGSTVSGTSVISFSGGTLAAGASCAFTVQVQIPSVAPAGSVNNVTSAIMASVNGGPVSGTDTATAVLTIQAAQPLSWSRAISPTSSAPGTTASFVYTITNPNSVTAGSSTFSENFSSFFPGTNTYTGSGVGCGAPTFSTTSDSSGSTGFSVTGIDIAANSTCTFTANVPVPNNTPSGTYSFNSSALTSTINGASVVTGSLAGALTVTGDASVSLTKAFNDTLDGTNNDAVTNGNQVEMSLTLKSADESTATATAITFTDDLNAFSTGTTGSVTSNTCDGTAVLSAGDTLLTVSGATLTTGAECTVTLALTLAGGSNARTTNTTQVGSFMAGGVSGSIQAASDSIFIGSVEPIIASHAYTPSTVLAGATPQISYTFTNPNPTDDATNLTATHNLSGVLSGLASTGIVSNTCGGGSSVSGTTFVIISGGAVPAGTSCEVVLGLNVPAGAVSGDYSGPTGANSATIDGATVSGDPSNATLTIENEPLLFAKAFASSSVAPGNTVALEFTLENPLSTPVTNVAFTDDLNAMLAGSLVASDISNSCGGTFATGGSMLAYSGGSLAANSSCTVRIGVSIDAGAANGVYTNTSSTVTADAMGSSVASNVATDTLTVSSTANTVFTLAFGSGAQVDPGGSIAGLYTINNSSASALSSLNFNHNLATAVPGMVATNLPISNPCGAGSSISGSGTVSFSGGSLAAGANCQFTVNYSVPSSATAGGVTSTTSALVSSGLTIAPAASGALTINDTADIAVTMTDSATTAIAGATTTYVTVVTNNGPSTDPAVGLNIDLSGTAGCAITPSASGGATGAAAAGPAVSSATQTLSMPIGSSVTYTSVCNIAASATGNLSVSSTVTPSITDPVSANNTVTDSNTISQSADMSITLADDTDPVLAGGAVTYTASVANAGPSDTTGTSVAVTLPAGLTFVSSTGCAEDPNGVPTCSLGAVTAGGNTSFTFTATAGATAGGQSTSATVSSAAADPAAGNDTANETTTISAVADIAVTMSDGATTAVSGQSTTFTTVVTNNGPSTDPAVAVALDYSATAGCSVTPSMAGGATGASAGGPALTSSNQTLSMPSGSSVTYSAVCAIAPLAIGTLDVSSTVTPSVADNVTANNTARDNDTVLTQSGDLSVTLADSVDPVNAGDNLTYTVNVSNTGPSVARNTVATFVIPTGMTLVSTAGCAEDPNGVPTCSLGDLLPTGSASFTVVASGTENILSSATAEVSVVSDATDPTEANSAATETTTVTQRSDISVTKTDGLTSVNAGETVSYTIVATNLGPSPDQAVRVVDTFDTNTNSCTTTPSALGGASIVSSVSGVTGFDETYRMPVGASVSYAVTCTVAPGFVGTLSNTAAVTSSSTDPVPGNNSATDNDTVVSANHDLVVSKSDGLTSAVAGTSITYTIVASNAGPSDATGATLTDTIPSNLTCTYTSVAAGGASGSTAAGSGNISDTLALPVGATVTYSASCLIAPTATGTLSNTATITGLGTDPNTTNNTATDADTAITPLTFGFTKAFAPTAVDVGQTSVLTLTIDNSANALAAQNMSFNDPLPTGMTLAAVSNASTTCTGGTIAAVGGSGTLGLSGASVAGGSVCTVTATVMTTASGSLTNTTSLLTSTFPDAGPAVANLAVNPAGAPLFTKSFTDSSVAQGATTTLTFDIDNSANSVAATTLAFSDTFPSGMVVGPIPALTNTCGGTVTASAGAGSVTLSGGTVALQSSCIISVAVRATDTGSLVNTSGDLTSDLPTATGPTATLQSVPAVMIFGQSFAPSTIVQGDTSRITFAIDNSNNAIEATSVAFTNALSGGLVVATDPSVSNGCGGTVTATAGASTISLAGGAVIATGRCAISVNVTAPDAGSIANTTSVLTSSLADVPAAAAILDVTGAAALSFAQAFLPTSITQGETSVLTFSLANGNLISADALAFTNTLPSGVTVADTPAASSTCGGAFAPTAGDGSLTFAGGTLAAQSTCEVSVALRAITVGDAVNTSSTLASSTVPVSPASTATLTVSAAGAPGFAKSFAPASIVQGEVTTLTFAIDNGANAIDLADAAFTDAFPSGMSVAATPNISNTCGGTVQAAAGASSMSLTGGAVATGATCAISLDVRAITVGDLVNTSSELTSSVTMAAAASATLTVTGSVAPGFAKSFAPNVVLQGDTSVLTLVVDNTGNAIQADTLAFTDTFPSGLVVADAPSATNTCGGTLVATAGSAVVSLTGGTVAEAASCEVSVRVRALNSGALNNVTSPLTSTLQASGTASATLTATAAPTPDFTKVFAVSSLTQGDVTTLTLSVDNSGSLVEATDIAFVDTFPAGMAVAPTPNTSSTCSRGTITAAAGDASLSYSGGSVAAGATCDVVVDVRAVTVGAAVNTTSDLTTSLGTSGPATATLDVTPTTGPSFAKVFAPSSIAQGVVSTLTYTIDNSVSLVDATALGFADSFPSGLSVAPIANATTTCSGGTLSASAGASNVSYSGGTIAAGATCTVTVDVTSVTVGAVTSTSGALTSSAGTGGTASATLTVTPASAPLLTQTFQPPQIVQGGSSDLVLTIDNRANGVDANNLGLTASMSGATVGGATASLINLSTGALSNACGGTLTAAPGGTSVTLTGGSVAAGNTCRISVPVTSTTLGSASVSASLTSSLGGQTLTNVTPLVVISDPNGRVTFVQQTGEDGTFNFTSSATALNFAITTAGGTGSAGPFSIAAGTYTIRQQGPSGFGNTSLVCSDANSTTDAASGTVTLRLEQFENVTCTYSSVNSAQESVETINAFMQRRNNLILSNGPNRARRLARLTQGIGTSQTLSFQNGDLKSFAPADFNLRSIGSGNYSISTSLSQVERAGLMFALAHDGLDNNTAILPNRRFDVWFEAHYNRFEASGASAGHFGIAYLGADYLISNDVLAGFMLQYDTLKDEDAVNGTSVDGTGWMAGPYVTARIAPNLIFDGRLAWGKSTNDLILSTSTGKFETERFLIDLNLSGNFDWNDWNVSPNFGLSYIEDKQDPFVNSLNVTVPGQKVSLGQAKFGPTFSKSYTTTGRMLVQPSFSVTGIYNFANTDGVTITNNTADETDGFRGRIEAAVKTRNRFGTEFNFGVNYDGIGKSDFESWGFNIGVNIPLQ